MTETVATSTLRKARTAALEKAGKAETEAASLLAASEAKTAEADAFAAQAAVFASAITALGGTIGGT